MKKQIQVNFGAGGIEILTTGYKGGSCLKARDRIQNELGLENAKATQELTEEYNQSETSASTQTHQSSQN